MWFIDKDIYFNVGSTILYRRSEILNEFLILSTTILSLVHFYLEFNVAINALNILLTQNLYNVDFSHILYIFTLIIMNYRLTKHSKLHCNLNLLETLNSRHKTSSYCKCDFLEWYTRFQPDMYGLDS